MGYYDWHAKRWITDAESRIESTRDVCSSGEGEKMVERARLTNRRPRRRSGVSTQKFESTFLPPQADALYADRMPVTVLRFAAALRIVQMYEEGRLPVTLMRAMDKMRIGGQRVR